MLYEYDNDGRLKYLKENVDDKRTGKFQETKNHYPLKK